MSVPKGKACEGLIYFVQGGLNVRNWGESKRESKRKRKSEGEGERKRETRGERR
jgi:hypothetical protein